MKSVPISEWRWFLRRWLRNTVLMVTSGVGLYVAIRIASYLPTAGLRAGAILVISALLAAGITRWEQNA